MAYHWKRINTKETSFIKGVAMLLILFHNYCHLIKPWNGENEFTFSYNSTTFFINLLKNNPSDFLQLIFSFFGHYGVQAFVFLSGYGLFLSYQNKKITWFGFMKKRLVKLYPAYFLTMILFLIILTVTTRSLPSWVQFRLAIADLLFLQSFIPGEAFRLVGPWWFFPMLIQLYAIFPLLMKASRKRGIRVVIITGILAWAITLIVNPFLDLQKYNLNYFFIGHLPVFCLGILFAQMKYFKLPNSVIALCLLVLIFGNLFDIIWPFTMLAAALLIIILSLKLQRTLKKYNRFSSSITIIGANSLYLFLVHGFLREPFVAIAQQHDNPFITILSGLAFLVLSLIVAWCIRKASTSIQHRADKLLIR